MSLKKFFGLCLIIFVLSGCTGSGSSSGSSSDTTKAAGLSNDDTWTLQKNWTWTCPVNTCEYRFIVDNSETTEPTGSYSSVAATSQAGPSGIYYLHIQTRTVVQSTDLSMGGTTSSFSEGSTFHYKAKIDVDGPTAPAGFADGDSTNSLSESPTMTWTSSTDAHSGVSYYEVALGTYAGAVDTMSWVNVGNVQTISFSNLSLTAGATYYGSVRAIDAAGNIGAVSSGDGFVVTAGGPTITGLANDATWLTSKNLSWSCSQAPCTYRYVIDQNTSTNPTGAYSSTDNTTHSAGTGTFYIHVQARSATNIAGAVAHYSFKLDNSGPGAVSSLDDGSFSSSTGNSPTLTWGAASDVESGVSSYELSIGSSAGLANVLSWQDVGLVTTYAASGLSLTNGSTYFVNIRAKDTLGNVGTVVSGNGFIVDISAPAVTGLANDAVWKSSKAWTWSCDSAPCTYRYTVDTNLVGVPTGSYSSTSAATITTGNGTYYLHVQAQEASGRESSVQTVSFKMDTTAPGVPGSFNDGSSTATTTTSTTFTWSAATDAHSGISHYLVAIGTTAGGSNIVSWDTTASTSYQKSGLNLTNGATYYASIRAVDGAGNLSTIVQGDGWTVQSLEQKILASDGAAQDNFGENLAAYGGVVAAAAQHRDYSSSTKAGAVYFFRLNGGAYAQEGVFVPTDHGINRYCGSSIDISWSSAIVACTNASYIVKFNGSSWAQEAKLSASSGSSSGSVAIDSDWAVVGLSEGVAGQIKIFRREGSTWSHFSTHDSPNANFTDGFGVSVDISGNLIAVGAIGVNNKGRVYIYRFDGSTWSLASHVEASDGADWDEFGKRVALSGHKLAVSAPARSTNAGMVYTYHLEGANWVEKSILDDPTPEANSEYGRSISIQGDYLIVGVKGIAGNTSGEAHVYRYTGSIWTNILSYAPTNDINSYYGMGTAIDGETIFVSDYFDADNGSGAGAFYARKLNSDAVSNTNLAASDSAVGNSLGGAIAAFGNMFIAGDRSNNSNIGAAYVFRKGVASWSQNAKLTPSDGTNADYFGTSVAMYGNLVAVGSPESDPNGFTSAGSVYIYRYNGTTWAETKISPAIDSSFEYGEFGRAVDLDGETLIVGAAGDDTQAANAGKVYVYGYDGTNWSKKAELVASDGQAGTSFGSDVAIKGNTIVASASTASNGSYTTGAVYVFQFDGTNWNQVQKITPPGTVGNLDLFADLDLDDGVLVVASLFSDIAGTNSGSLYFFHHNGTQFVHKSTHQVSGAAANQNIVGVSIFGGTAVVGQDQANGSYGKQYVFKFNGTSWSESTSHSPFTGVATFGVSSAIFGTQIFGGAPILSPGGAVSVIDY